MYLSAKKKMWKEASIVRVMMMMAFFMTLPLLVNILVSILTISL